ncbi:MAG: POTRA domain-containing protein, partial [bacterium]
MMARSLYITTLFLILFCNSHSQTKIQSLDITGNSYYTTSDILNLMVSKKDGTFSIEQFKSDLKTIRDKYKTSGFLFVKFSEDQTKFTDDSDFVEIDLKISEGNKVNIGEIVIEGNSVFSKENILKKFETKTGENLNDLILNEDIKDLLQAYEKKGLPFAKINIRDVSVYKDNGVDK